MTSARRRAPLRLPIWEEGLPQAAPAVQQTAFHPVSASPLAPAPAPPALSVVHSPPPAPQRAAHKQPLTVARAFAPKPLAPSPVRVTPSLVREVQRRLKRQGYPVGRIDGRIGRKTAQSIRRFRLDVSLSPTGGIDRRLMASLGIEGYNGWSAEPVARTYRYSKPKSRRWEPSRAQIKEVQRRLALIGYHPGPADGLIGRQTAQAVKSFQRQVGLKATGRIDRSILQRLSVVP
ncbi:MAG: peptidoglycan-binding protein [Nitrospinae bacterium]|nr:peptidoglycan-binding protein [Nitrospinota bacterium]